MAFVTENIFLIAVALISGGMLFWPMIMNRGLAAVSLDTLGATRLINDRNPVVVDVRSAAEFSGGHLPNSRNIPLEELDRRASELPANRPVLLVCQSGARSGRAVAKLKAAGRTEVFSLAGGVQGWAAGGLPTVR